MTGSVKLNRTRRDRGQGVIEYAGALVVAAVLVATAMFVVPNEVASLINNVMTSAVTYFTSFLP